MNSMLEPCWDCGGEPLLTITLEKEITYDYDLKRTVMSKLYGKVVCYSAYHDCNSVMTTLWTDKSLPEQLRYFRKMLIRAWNDKYHEKKDQDLQGWRS